MAMVASMLKAGLPHILVLAVLLLGWSSQLRPDPELDALDALEFFSGQAQLAAALRDRGLKVPMQT
jgi:hypothetical protein